MNSPRSSSVQAAGQHLVALLDLDVAVEPQPFDDLLEQVFQHLGRIEIVELLGVRVASAASRSSLIAVYPSVSSSCAGAGAGSRALALCAVRAADARARQRRLALGAGATRCAGLAIGRAVAGLRAGRIRARGGGGIRRRMKYCWPTVHRFVVIQYTSSPAGYL